MPFKNASTLVKLSVLCSSVGTLLLVAVVFFASTENPREAVAKQFPVALSLNNDDVEARAALVYDPAERRILYSKNASASLPLASLTKLMSAQAVLEAHKGKDKIVTITEADLEPEGDWGFWIGDIVRLSDLIKMSLVASSNDAMAAAAASLGDDYINELNATAGRLGLSNTYFLNSTGLDLSEETAGAYGSALDVARLAAAFMKQYPEYFELTADESVSIPDGDRVLTAKSTALPLLSIPGFIGAKTGYTDLAGGNLVAAFDLEVGHPVIVVVLGSSEAGRFVDVEMLITAARAAQKNIEL